LSTQSIMNKRESPTIDEGGEPIDTCIGTFNQGVINKYIYKT